MSTATDRAATLDDYGEATEAALATKRADYFEAGTLVVWDVDPIHQVIHK